MIFIPMYVNVFITLEWFDYNLNVSCNFKIKCELNYFLKGLSEEFDKKNSLAIWK